MDRPETPPFRMIILLNETRRNDLRKSRSSENLYSVRKAHQGSILSLKKDTAGRTRDYRVRG